MDITPDELTEALLSVGWDDEAIVRKCGEKLSDHEQEECLTNHAEDYLTSEYYLISEYPIALLKGEYPLSAFGIRDGSILTLCHDEKGEIEEAGCKMQVKETACVPVPGKLFHRRIDLSDERIVTIGFSRGCHIFLRSSCGYSGSFSLIRNGQKWTIRNKENALPVFRNGRRISDGEELTERDFLVISGYSFYFREQSFYTERRADLSVNLLPIEDFHIRDQYPVFLQNTRIRTVISDEDIEILEPSPVPQKPDSSFLMRILPAMGMITASGFMAMRGGLTMLLFSAVTAAMGIFSGTASFLGERKRYQKELVQRSDIYHRYLFEKTREIVRHRKEERIKLDRIYHPIEQIREHIFQFSVDLFDRIPEDDDFLCVRLGTGNIPAKQKIKHRKQEHLEEDILQTMPAQIKQEYDLLPDAPVICRFREIGAVGIAGAEKDRFQLFKNIVIDIAARHFYSDVKMLFIAAPEHAERIHWLRFLPHTRFAGGTDRGIATDEESRTQTLEYLYQELAKREHQNDKAFHLIVFLYDRTDFSSHPVARYVSHAEKLRTTFVFFGEDHSQIMPGCRNIIDLINGENAILINAFCISDSIRFQFHAVTDSEAEQMVRFLAPVRADEISLGNTLTKEYSLYEMLEIYKAEEIDLEKNWAISEIYRSMAAPIGITGSGKVFLDLHDSAHGPHGLVAGTTGSGKSEILLTYIVSMAVLYPPTEVNFLLIDFKGGGTVNRIRSLPHMAGVITNIDEKNIQRSLRSIKAELLKRQRLFEQEAVNHIDTYARKFKKGEIALPLPHLLIIIDEFAELKAEQPEFMKELISASRIGRSLGVHLILATQKPSGQVSEQIWSNSRFKICLKVQDTSDSHEMIKSPLAAEIREPGRAYLQVGNNEIFELFQSAYGAGPPPVSDESEKRYCISCISDSGEKTPVYKGRSCFSKETEHLTQLQEVVNHIGSYCSIHKICSPAQICLPPLEENILYRQRKVPQSQAGIWADIGIYDDPDHQCRGLYSVDLNHGNLLVIGSSGSGKTNILQCIIRSIAAGYSPEEVSVYILDFASMFLKNYEKLCHVGAVICSSDTEKLMNLFKMLGREMYRRRRILSEEGFRSFRDFREAGHQGMPFILLLIDNLTALRELFFQDDSELLNLCREGQAAGIGMVLTNPQISGAGYRYISCFSQKIALYCNDSGEYNSLFEHCRDRPDAIPGRGLIMIERKLYECQSFLAFRDAKGREDSETIASFLTEINQTYPEVSAVPVPMIPAVLTAKDMERYFHPDPDRLFEAAVGLDYATIQPLILDLESAGMLGILDGTEKKGNQWIFYVIQKIFQNSREKVKVYLADGFRKQLAFLKEHPAVERYSSIPSGAAEIVLEAEQQLKERYEAMIEEDTDRSDLSDLILLVMDHENAAEAFGDHPEAMSAFRNLVGKYRHMHICIFLTGIENSGISYNSDEMLRYLKDTRHVLFFGDIRELKLFDVPMAVMRDYAGTSHAGDGFYIKGGEYRKIKMPC